MQKEHFFSPILGEDQKKKSSARVEHFFPQMSAQLLVVHPFKSWGDADVDHSQTIGEIYPPIPPGFRHPCSQHSHSKNGGVKKFHY